VAFSTNKADHHDIAEILLKVALNTINQSTSIEAAKSLTVILIYKRRTMTLFIRYIFIIEITVAKYCNYY
jgi:hypothetical protein